MPDYDEHVQIEFNSVDFFTKLHEVRTSYVKMRKYWAEANPSNSYLMESYLVAKEVNQEVNEFYARYIQS